MQYYWSIILSHSSEQLLDVYAHKGNMNLVLEYLDSDLEQIIKDRSLVFTAANIKSWMLMTLRGIDHCHRNWIVHRVSRLLPCCNHY
jgi:cyclin-dependent kinase 7